MRYLVPIVLLNMSSVTAYAESNISGEILFGQAQHRLHQTDFELLHNEASSVGLRGSLWLNPGLGFELAVQDYGLQEETYQNEFAGVATDRVETSALNVGIVGTVPLSRSLSVNGKVGVANWSVRVTTFASGLPGFSQVYELDGSDVYYGFGAKLDLSSRSFLGFDYTVTDLTFDEPIGLGNEIENYSISLGVRL